jgi:hypothetical protein
LVRCDEVEKKDEETRRKKIEEQLTQALIRYHFLSVLGIWNFLSDPELELILIMILIKRNFFF